MGRVVSSDVGWQNVAVAEGRCERRWNCRGGGLARCACTCLLVGPGWRRVQGCLHKDRQRACMAGLHGSRSGALMTCLVRLQTQTVLLTCDGAPIAGSLAGEHSGAWGGQPGHPERHAAHHPHLPALPAQPAHPGGRQSRWRAARGSGDSNGSTPAGGSSSPRHPPHHPPRAAVGVCQGRCPGAAHAAHQQEAQAACQDAGGGAQRRALPMALARLRRLACLRVAAGGCAVVQAASRQAGSCQSWAGLCPELRGSYVGCKPCRACQDGKRRAGCRCRNSKALPELPAAAGGAPPHLLTPARH